MKSSKPPQRDLKIQYVPIEDLKPDPTNPRKWTHEQEEKLEENIAKNGFVEPVIINENPDYYNNIVGGHFRYHIAKKLGIRKIPVVYINLTGEQQQKLNLQLNANQGEWNFEMLRNFDTALLLDVGFDDADFQRIFDDFIEVEDDNFDVEEKLKEIKEPFVKEGEVWSLGKHRLICGDSTKPETFEKLLRGEKVGFITADPPFNICLDYNKGIGGKGKYGGSKVQDNKTNKEYQRFLSECLQNGLNASLPNAHFFCWADERYIGLVQSIYEELGVQNKRVCLWLKNSQMSTPQVAFSKVYEPCIYSTRGEPFLSTYHTNFTEVMNKELGTGNRLHGDVLDLFSIWLEKRLPSSDYLHPTEKPPSLYERAIRRCTKPGDIILELFGGSGSVLVAAEQLKRTCYLVELDPLFSSLIITRYENLTGQKATKLN